MNGLETFLNMEVTGLVWWGALVICLALSFLCSGMEAGFLSLNPLRITQWARSNDRKAKLLESYMQDPEHFLRIALVVNTTSNFLVMTLVISKLFVGIYHHSWLIFIILCPFLFLFYTTCELAPKMLFSRFPNRLCLKLVGVFNRIDYWVSPFANFLFRIASLFLPKNSSPTVARSLVNSREELKELMRETALGLTADEKELIANSLTLSVRTLEKITKPFSEATVFYDNDILETVLSRSEQKPYTRAPVLESKPDIKAKGSTRAVGILNIKNILFDETNPDPKSLVLPWTDKCLRLPQDMELESALRRMQSRRARMAIVTRKQFRNGKEFEEDWGLVTLQDILTVVFGNVHL
jgi:putative hemolysin